MIAFFILLYVLNGKVVLEQKAMPSMEVCQEQGEQIVNEKLLNPNVNGVITAGCIQLPAQEVKK